MGVKAKYTQIRKQSLRMLWGTQGLQRRRRELRQLVFAMIHA